MKSYTKNGTILAIVTVLVFTASWGFYRLMNKLIMDLLAHFGIVNEYYQFGILIVFVLLILVLVGIGFKEGLKRILKL